MIRGVIPLYSSEDDLPQKASRSSSESSFPPSTGVIVTKGDDMVPLPLHRLAKRRKLARVNRL